MRHFGVCVCVCERVNECMLLLSVRDSVTFVSWTPPTFELQTVEWKEQLSSHRIVSGGRSIGNCFFGPSRFPLGWTTSRQNRVPRRTTPGHTRVDSSCVHCECVCWYYGNGMDAECMLVCVCVFCRKPSSPRVAASFCHLVLLPLRRVCDLAEFILSKQETERAQTGEREGEWRSAIDTRS